MGAVDLGVNLFVALFALVDPIGNVPIFAAATAGATARQRMSVSALLCAFVVVFLCFFFFTGLGLLEFFGISLAAFRIAGGILLLVVPFAMPLLIGPGAISTIIIPAGAAERLGPAGTTAGVIAIVAAAAVTFVCFSLTGAISKLLGEVGMSIVVRVLGLILCALAIQFIIIGLSEATQGFITTGAAAPYADKAH